MENVIQINKKLGNYPDPYIILNNSGSDAMRWFLESSSIMHGGNVCMDYEGKEVAKAMRQALMPLWNAYYFFCLYANAEGIKAKEISNSNDVLDKYILAKLKDLVKSVHKYMLNYDIPEATTAFTDFLDILNR